MYRKHTPNSNDDLLAHKQEDKVGVELATKAHQPRVQALFVRLLNEYQVKMQKAHDENKGKEGYTKPDSRILQMEQEIGELQPSNNSEAPLPPDITMTEPRTRRPPDRYVDTAFDSKGQRKAPPTDTDTVCPSCGYAVELISRGVECHSCDNVFHLSCVALEKKPKLPFQCPICEGAAQDDMIIDSGGTNLRQQSLGVEEDSEGSTADESDDIYRSEGDSSSEDDDSSDEDYDPNMNSRDARKAWKEERDIVGEEDPMTYLTLKDFQQFSDEFQLGTDESEKKLLLSLPYNYTYTIKDLSDETVLSRALSLLYAARTGEGDLRTRPHIHIKYTELRTRLGDAAIKEMLHVGADLSTFMKTSTG